MLSSSPEGLRAFDRALFDSCALLRPPEKLDVAEWADKYGYLSPEGAARPGKWFTSSAEYEREAMRELANPAIQNVVLCWPSQVGKSQIGFWAVGYFAHHDPRPQLLVQPTEEMCKTVVKDRINPMIRDTPVLRAIFGVGRGSGNDLFHKSFPGGHLSMGWASSPAQLASRPISFLWTDEEDRYDAGGNREGNAVDQARKRMATFTNRKHLRTSSPALRRTSSIHKAFLDSDQRHFYLPCPQCQHPQILRWEQLKWPTGRAADCYYVCEANGCEIREDEKFSMILKGEWRAHAPAGGKDGKTAGFHLNALYSTIGYTWTEIINDYLACEGIPDRLQVFTNTVLAEPWDEEAHGADLNAVQKHAEPYPAPAPAWSVIFTCGADVQRDRIEATKWGFGLNHTSGVIEHRIFHGATVNSNGGAWKDFDTWRRQPVEHESGLLLPVACTFVDSGDGERTQAVYEYCRAREREKVFACKGSSLPAAPLVAEAKRVGRFRTLMVMVGVSNAKDVIYGRLAIDDRAAPGYIHFPSDPAAGCSPEFFAQLTSEARVVKHTKGGDTSVWEPQRKRNEALDIAAYALGAKEFTRANLREQSELLKRKAARLDPAELAARRAAWAEKVGETSARLFTALSEPHKPAPNLHNSRIKSAGNARKRIKRPGFAWINGQREL